MSSRRPPMTAAASLAVLAITTGALVATMAVARPALADGPALADRPALANGTATDPTTATCTAATLPRHDLLDAALAAYRRVESAGLVRTHVLTIIDYSLPASERRLWVIDPDTQRVLFHELVAHGRGSATEDDPERAVSFGNDLESHRSSLGTFLTGDTYDGVHGHSLELVGLDVGVNDRAVERRIVMHPAPYVTLAHRVRWGHIGRSFGCPALDPAAAPAIIGAIRDGSVVYAAGASGPLMRVAASDAALVRVAQDGATLARVLRSDAALARSGATVMHSGATRARSGAALARTAHRPAALATAAGARRRAAATPGRRSSAASSRT